MTTPPDLLFALEEIVAQGRPELARLADQLDAALALRSATYAVMERDGIDGITNIPALLARARNELERAELTALADRLTHNTKESP